MIGKSTKPITQDAKACATTATAVIIDRTNPHCVAASIARNEFTIAASIAKRPIAPINPKISATVPIALEEPTKFGSDKTMTTANARDGIDIQPNGAQR